MRGLTQLNPVKKIIMIDSMRKVHFLVIVLLKTPAGDALSPAIGLKNFLFAASGCAFFGNVASAYISKYRSSTLQWINFLMAFAAIPFYAAGQRFL